MNKKQTQTGYVKRQALALLLAMSFVAGPPASAGQNGWTGSGPHGGRATRVLVEPGNADRMYALGSGSGLFISDDSGATWAPLNVDHPDIVNSQISDIALDPNAPDTLFVVDNGGEVARSVDGGQTWTASTSGLQSGLFYLYADLASAGTMYATSTAGLFKSTDNGDTWSELSAGLGLSVINELIRHPSDSSLLLAVGWEGVFKSVNGGATWSDVSAGLPTNPNNGYVFARTGAIDTLNADVAYVVVSNNGVYKTIDGGASWASFGTGVPSDFFTNMKIDPSDNTRLYMTTGNNDVIVSTNSGASWQNLPNVGLGDYTIDDLDFDPTNSARMIIASFTQGLFVSTDAGANWSRSSEGFVNENVESLSIDEASGRIYAGVFGGTSSSADDGATWEHSTGSYDLTSFAIQADPLVPGHAYAGSSCCGLYESFDSGVTWARIDLQLPSVVATWVTDIDIPKGNPQQLVFSDFNRGLFGTEDGGLTWRQYSVGLQQFFSGNVVLSGVDASDNNPAVIYVSSPDFNSGGVFKSTDGGVVWTRKSGDGLPGPSRAESIAVHADNPDIVFVGGTSNLQYSTDGGDTWQFPATAVAGKVRSIHIDIDNPQLMYAVGENSNLYRSVDGGVNWAAAPEDLGSARLNALVVDPSDRGRVLVGYDNLGYKEFTYATDLSLGLNASAFSADIGEPVVIEATTTNNGPLAANAVTMTQAVPAGFAIANLSATQGSCASVAQDIACDLGDLALGAAVTVTVTLDPQAGGSFDTVPAVASLESDTLPADNAATIALTIGGGPDSDGDGVGDSVDNCTAIANTDQTDADADGYGNACDADLNNDCIVNVIDLGVLRTVFFTSDAAADFNGDGIVNVVDLGVLRTLFFMAPGPSAGGSCGS